MRLDVTGLGAVGAWGRWKWQGSGVHLIRHPRQCVVLIFFFFSCLGFNFSGVQSGLKKSKSLANLLSLEVIPGDAVSFDVHSICTQEHELLS